MPDSQNNNSFIPKQGPAKQARRAISRQVHIFTIFSYIFFFSTILATAGVFFYDRVVDSQLEVAITDLNTKIESFKISDMDAVREFNNRVKQVQNRIDKSVSVSTIFDALEASTIGSVQLVDLSLERKNDTQYQLTSTIETNNFDSALFQRGTYESNAVVRDIEVSDVEIVSEEIEGGDIPTAAKRVRFTAQIAISADTIPFTPNTEAATANLNLSNPDPSMSEVQSTEDATTVVDEEIISTDNI